MLKVVLCMNYIFNYVPEQSSSHGSFITQKECTCWEFIAHFTPAPQLTLCLFDILWTMHHDIVA
jgi:hypothetical protein